MEKRTIRLVSILLLVVIMVSCSTEREAVDMEYPAIHIDWPDAFPVQCSEIKRGEPFAFRARFSDNVALGSFSLDIHHNFDHHSHSTELQECERGEEKEPVNPFVYIQSFDIAGNSVAYEAETVIMVPEDIDPGDYHFMIRVTDKEGWQTMRGLSIKITE